MSPEEMSERRHEAGVCRTGSTVRCEAQREESPEGEGQT